VAVPWTLRIGEIRTRTALAEQYGGSVYSGGIVTATASQNIFVFSDPEVGAEFGYNFDGLSEDNRVFNYTGQGTLGHQEISGPNRSLLEHHDRGFRLRLFVAAGTARGGQAKLQRYLGEYAVDPLHPYWEAVAPDKSGVARVVLVFRLVGVADTEFEARVIADFEPEAKPQALLVKREASVVERFMIQSVASREAERSETRLVEDFVQWSNGGADRFQRWAINVPGSRQPLFTDIYDTTANVLYEAKSEARRSDVRMAVGQLLDYQRFMPNPGVRLRALLPTSPGQDLTSLLASQNIGLAYRQGASFEQVS
jgi:hypothetical protein